MPPKKKLLLLLIPVITFFFGVLATFAFLHFSANNNQSNRVNRENDSSNKDNNLGTEAVKAGRNLSNNNCEGTEKRKLGTLPMRYEDFSMIIPYGLMVGDHVTPIDHQYFSPTVFHSPRDQYEVRAMADAKLVDIGERTTERGTEYRLVFTISCTLFYYYDLVTSLEENIFKTYQQARLGERKQPLNIPVKEGQLIGRIGGQTLDFAVWDTERPLKGFIVTKHYEAERWKIYTADPLNYYTDELKQLALSKYIRTVEPISGKIDYDIDGKAVGNWFVEGVGGYVSGRDYFNSYKNHLSITYDNYDPGSIVFSIGEYSGEPRQFGVKGNNPDPKEISTETGLVKYELVERDWVEAESGNSWDRFSFVKGVKAKNQERVLGVALIQMSEARKLRVEVFPNKVASQVSGFTSKAVVYER